MSLITAVDIISLSFPLEKSFSNHVRPVTHISGIVIKLLSNQGVVAQGFLYGLSSIVPEDIIACLKTDIVDHLLSVDGNDSEKLMAHWKSFWHSYKSGQLTQTQLYALAVADIAVWDLFTKMRNISLYEFLGKKQSKVLVYGTTGWLSLSDVELVAECKFYASIGVNAFKVRLGHQDDEIRVAALRAAIGEDFVLMADANQRYSLDQTAQVSDKFSPFNLKWLEEPTDNALANISVVKNVSKIPIALGENIFSEDEFRAICENKWTDYLQPDLPRCGGITGFCRVADIALEYGMPICNHLLWQVSVGLLAAYSNGYMLEYDNLLPSGIFVHEFPIKDGYIYPLMISGVGAELTEDALEKYRKK